MVGAKASHYWRQMTELKKFDFPWILTSWVAAYKKTQYISKTPASLSIWLKSAYEIQMISFNKKLGKIFEGYIFNQNSEILEDYGFFVRLVCRIIKISVYYAYKGDSLNPSWKKSVYNKA